LLVSEDGAQWSSGGFPNDIDVTRAAFGNGWLLAPSFDGTRVFRSTNGVDWAAAPTGFLIQCPLTGFAAGHFFLLGVTGLLLSSVDGESWEPHWIEARLPRISGYPGGFLPCTAGMILGNDQQAIIAIEAFENLGYYAGYLGHAGFLLVSDPVSNRAPAIVRPPQSMDLAWNAAGSLSATAYGASPLSYQWLKEGLPVANATNAVLEIIRAGPGDAGDYRVVATNAFGSVTSAPTSVVVSPASAAALGMVEVLPPSTNYSGTVSGTVVNAGANLQLTGPLGAAWTIETRNGFDGTNAWIPTRRVLQTQSPQLISDPGATNARSRFYRARSEP
jgi:hypothetical protein